VSGPPCENSLGPYPGVLSSVAVGADEVAEAEEEAAPYLSAADADPPALQPPLESPRYVTLLRPR